MRRSKKLPLMSGPGPFSRRIEPILSAGSCPLRPESVAEVRSRRTGLVRVSVGLEHPDDIVEDVLAALEQA